MAPCSQLQILLLGDIHDLVGLQYELLYDLINQITISMSVST